MLKTENEKLKKLLLERDQEIENLRKTTDVDEEIEEEKEELQPINREYNEWTGNYHDIITYDEGSTLTIDGDDRSERKKKKRNKEKQLKGKRDDEEDEKEEEEEEKEHDESQKKVKRKKIEDEDEKIEQSQRRQNKHLKRKRDEEDKEERRENEEQDEPQKRKVKRKKKEDEVTDDLQQSQSNTKLGYLVLKKGESVRVCKDCNIEQDIQQFIRSKRVRWQCYQCVLKANRERKQQYKMVNK